MLQYITQSPCFVNDTVFCNTYPNCSNCEYRFKCWTTRKKVVTDFEPYDVINYTLDNVNKSLTNVLSRIDNMNYHLNEMDKTFKGMRQ